VAPVGAKGVGTTAVSVMPLNEDEVMEILRDG
jgi:hypothetical protein